MLSWAEPGLAVLSWAGFSCVELGLAVLSWAGLGRVELGRVCPSVPGLSPRPPGPNRWRSRAGVADTARRWELRRLPMM